jgi:chemotaxis signal transduction protein
VLGVFEFMGQGIAMLDLALWVDLGDAARQEPALLPFPSAQAEGLCAWRGRHVPVTSLGKCYPALARNADRAPPLLAVFECDGAALGVLIDRVPQIRLLAATDASLAVAAGARRPTCCATWLAQPSSALACGTL